MARKKRGGFVEAEEHLSDSDRDSVDEHVARRHARLAAEARGSDSDSDSDGMPENAEREVLQMDLSDSEDDGPLKKPSTANIVDSSDEEGAGEDDADEEQDEDGNWGGRRNKYYGGDTQEHEIMEDEEREEVLAEEEAEAVRLQQKQVADLTADDYGVQADVEKDDSDEGERDEMEDAAPELGALANELEKYYSQLALWGERASWGEKARTRYHLYAAYTSNIAFYFTLCTDPDAADVDGHSHDVLRRIVDLRTLISKHEKLLIAVPDEEPPSPVVAIQKEKEKSDEEVNEVVTEKKEKVKTRKKERSAKKKTKDKERKSMADGVAAKGDNNLEALDDDSFAEKLIAKKRKRKAKEIAVPHVYTFDDTADVNERRRASTQVALNKGLTRYRPKEKKTPRTKNKAAYAKAVKKRKTMVREAVAIKPGVSYGGEASGINMSARNSARLSNF